MWIGWFLSRLFRHPQDGPLIAPHPLPTQWEGKCRIHEDVDRGLATTSAIRLAYQRFGVPAVSALWERRSLHVLILGSSGNFVGGL
jgi:hypothetical protein